MASKIRLYRLVSKRRKKRLKRTVCPKKTWPWFNMWKQLQICPNQLLLQYQFSHQPPAPVRMLLHLIHLQHQRIPPKTIRPLYQFAKRLKPPGLENQLCNIKSFCRCGCLHTNCIFQTDTLGLMKSSIINSGECIQCCKWCLDSS